MKSGKLLLVLCTCSTIAFSMEESIVPPASTEASLDQVASEIVETVAPAVAEQLADAPVQASGWMNVGSRVFGYCSSQIGRATSGLARGITKGSWNMMRFMARPEMRKTEIMVAGAAAIWGITRAAANRARLYEKAHQCGLYRRPRKWGFFNWLFLSEDVDSTCKQTYNWKRKKYPTAASIKQEAEEQVVSGLIKDLAITDIRCSDGMRITKKEILLQRIEGGLEELENVLTELTEYACFPAGRYDLIGIKKIISDCCLQIDDEKKCEEGTTYSDFETNDLSGEQEERLDELVKNAIEKKWIHLITLRPNLGLAAKIYWETLKRLKRLQAIKGVVSSCTFIPSAWPRR